MVLRVFLSDYYGCPTYKQQPTTPLEPPDCGLPPARYYIAPPSTQDSNSDCFEVISDLGV